MGVLPILFIVWALRARRPCQLSRHSPSKLARFSLLAGGPIGLPLRASNDTIDPTELGHFPLKGVAWIGPNCARRSNYMVPPSLLVLSQGWGLIDLPLRATFSPARPLARRDVPLARARVFQSSSSLDKGVAKAALYCAHRTSTVSPCAFCEQEGHLAAPSLFFLGRALREHRRSSGSIPFSVP
jgi:hypothetical protein